MGAQPATLKIIAEQAGVSIMTVSRALRAHPEVNENTRQRILQLARELGYRPDARMSELMAYIRQKNRPEFSGTLAILRGFSKVGDEVPHYVTNELQIRGAHQHANALGYKIDEFELPFDGTKDRRLGTILKARGISGLILYPPPQPGSVLTFDVSDFCPVAYSTNLKSPAMNRVIGNPHHTVQVCMERLVERGYKRIGMSLYTVTDTNTNHDFLPAFLLHQYLAAASDRIPPLIYTDLGEDGYNQFIKWVRRYRPVVIVSHDTVALEWLLRGKVKVPEEVGFVNLSQNNGDSLPTAGLHENPGDMGSLLIDVVLTLVRSKEMGLPLIPRDSYSQATWNDGPTLTNRAKAPS